MKHKISITILLLVMFLVAQFIGIFVGNAYSPITLNVTYPSTGETETISIKQNLPFGLEPPENEPTPNFLSLIFAFILAFVIISIMMKYKWKFIMRTWFFIVIILSLGITINALLKNYLINATIIALIISILLAYLKVYRPNPITHNFTELLIYPGIAAVFIPILTPLSVVILLFLISIYDMWAVWKSGIMQKMAKFHMEELKIFGGFLIPTVSKKVKMQIKKIKQKYKGKKMPKRIKNKKFKINFAILGGGDIVFPIITSGVFLRSFGIIPALFVILGAFIGLAGLLAISKKKAYPAMPYITTGIFLGLLIWKFLI